MYFRNFPEEGSSRFAVSGNRILSRRSQLCSDSAETLHMPHLQGLAQRADFFVNTLFLYSVSFDLWLAACSLSVLQIYFPVAESSALQKGL